MYDFYTETNANTTFHLLGKAIQFRRAYFSTEDRELAEAMLEHCSEWGIQPGDWAKRRGRRGSNAAACNTAHEMSVPEPKIPATIKGRRRRDYTV